MDELMLWWGYIHTETGSLIVKKYVNFRDLEEVKESSFVGRIYGPFMAANRDAAMDILEMEAEE